MVLLRGFIYFAVQRNWVLEVSLCSQIALVLGLLAAGKKEGISGVLVRII
jgi:hypothetical protein